MGTRKTGSRFLRSMFIKKSRENGCELFKIQSKSWSWGCVEARCKNVVGKVGYVDGINWSSYFCNARRSGVSGNRKNRRDEFVIRNWSKDVIGGRNKR